METFWQDLGYAWRRLWRSPGFALVALTTLTLGIGATSVVTSVASQVLLQDLPYPNPERLVFLENQKTTDGVPETFPTSWLDFQDWRRRTTSFEVLALHSYSLAFNLTADAAEPERVNGEVVTSSYFPLLGLKPVLGRTFLPEDERAKGSPRYVILGHSFWMRRYNGDPKVLGRNLIVDGEGYQILGVLPEGFRGLTDESEIWLPVMMGNDLLGDVRFLDWRGVRWLLGVGRLKPGVTVAQAQADVNALSAALEKEFPDTNEDFGIDVKPLKTFWFGDLRLPLLTLLGASLFVLLIAWTTVANLLLARAVARQREISMRTALGATRRRLMGQLVTESLLLAVLSCALGLLLAQACTGLLVKASSVQFRSFVHIGLSPLVVGVILALSLACGLIFGLAPAWLNTRSGSTTIREGSSSSGPGRQHFQSALVIAEVALSLFLLIGAGLMIKGFQHFRQTDLGFRPDGLLTARVDVKGKRYAETGAMVRLARLYHDRLRALPGVASEAIVGPAMPTDGWFANAFVVEDLLKGDSDGVVVMAFHHVTPGYFSLMGIPLLEGRDFDATDTENSPLSIIITEAMKKKYWPNESPLGKRMRFGRRDPSSPWFTVVGVVGNLNQAAIQEEEWPGPDVYFDVLQFPPLLIPRLTFMIRPEKGLDALALAKPVQAALQQTAPDLPPFDVDTMSHRLEKFTAKGRFLVLLMSLYAGIALIMAAAGLYGVLFYSVTQRARELGIRVALGAGRADLVRLIVGRGALLVTSGLVIGMAAAILFNRLFDKLLYGVSSTDLLTFAGTSLLLFAVAMVAIWHPTRRALQVPPTIALRTE